tara:strand:+ start:41 stop:1402 length:1362 start_codon:yes stop_codon:yes gene_type:complete
MKNLNTFLFIVILLLTYANNSEANKWVLEGVNDAEFDSIVEENFVDNPKVNPPDWVLGRAHPEFPLSKYIVGVGYSEKNTVAASVSARIELIKSIRVKVNSIIKDYHSTDKSFVEASSSSETDFLLEGSQTKDGWYDSDKGIFYSLVVIERKYVLATIQEYIDNIVSNSSLSIRQADTYFNNGEIIKALVHYYDGYLQSKKLFPYIQTYKSVSMLQHQPKVEQDYTLLFKEKIQNIIGNIEVVDDKQILNGTDIKYLVKVTFKKNPVSGFPCEFNGTSGFVEKVLSNQNGICESNFRIRETTKKHIYIMNAMVDMPSFKQNFNYALKKDFFGRLELIDVMFRMPYSPKQVVVAKPVIKQKQERRYVPEPDNGYNSEMSDSRTMQQLTTEEQFRRHERRFARELKRDQNTYNNERNNSKYPRHYQRFNKNNNLNFGIGIEWGNRSNGGRVQGQW